MDRVWASPPPSGSFGRVRCCADGVAGAAPEGAVHRRRSARSCGFEMSPLRGHERSRRAPTEGHLCGRARLEMSHREPLPLALAVSVEDCPQERHARRQRTGVNVNSVRVVTRAVGSRLGMQNVVPPPDLYAEHGRTTTFDHSTSRQPGQGSAWSCATQPQQHDMALRWPAQWHCARAGRRATMSLVRVWRRPLCHCCGRSSAGGRSGEHWDGARDRSADDERQSPGVSRPTTAKPRRAWLHSRTSVNPAAANHPRTSAGQWWCA